MHGGTGDPNKIITILKEMNLHSVSVFILITTLVLWGAPVKAQTNYRTYIKGGMTAGGSLLKNGDVRYSSIIIGQPGAPLDGKFMFSIRLNNGTILKSTDFYYAQISSCAKEVKPFRKNNEWGEEIKEFTIDGMCFVFLKEHCVSFRANYVKLPDKIYAPEIGTADKKEFYKMPLSEVQLEHIFGKPERFDDKTVL